MSGKYTIPKTRSVNRVAFTEEYVKGKDILHVGVGGAITDLDLKDKFLKTNVSNWFHSKISKTAKSIATLELEQDNIDKFKEIIPGDYILGDITDPGVLENFGEKKYELIVFTEIIEHIDCFRTALQNMRSLLKPGGQILISTVNAYNIFSFVKLLFRYESNHIEHTSYFSYLTIKQLLWMNQLQIDEFYFAHDYPKKFLTRMVKYFFYRLTPQYSQGILVLASNAD